VLAYLFILALVNGYEEKSGTNMSVDLILQQNFRE
jgi:hypothetical protein